jgi:hypothetical protein
MDLAPEYGGNNGKKLRTNPVFLNQFKVSAFTAFAPPIFSPIVACRRIYTNRQLLSRAVTVAQRNRALKPFLIGSIIFLTLGVAIASEALSRLGLEGNYVYLFSVAFVVTAIMLRRNFLLLLVLVVGVSTINLPEAMLLQYHLNRDVLLAVICAIILVPVMYERLMA